MALEKTARLRAMWPCALVNLCRALDGIASARVSFGASGHPETETPEWLLESFDIPLEMLLPCDAAGARYPFPSDLEARLRRFGDVAHEAVDWFPPDRDPDYSFRWYAAKLRGETPDPVALGAGTPNPKSGAEILASATWSALASEARELLVALEPFVSSTPDET